MRNNIKNIWLFKISLWSNSFSSLLVLSIVFVSCSDLNLELKPTPSIWMSKDFCIYGDTVHLKDLSSGASSSFWTLPDKTISELKEFDLITSKVKAPRLSYIGLTAVGEDNFSRSSQTKLLTVYPQSWIAIENGTQIDTIIFRGGISHTQLDNHYVKVYRIAQTNRPGGWVELFRMKTYDLSYASSSYSVMSIPVTSNFSVPKITNPAKIVFRVGIVVRDTGLVEMIYPMDSGVVQTTSTEGFYGYHFTNLPGRYFSTRPNQVSDTLNVRISGVVYPENFDYVKD